MRHLFRHQPVFSILDIFMEAEETVVAQPNSMLAMTSGIRLAARVRQAAGTKSWFSGFKRMLGGESFFLAEFRAIRGEQVLTLAPDAYGDILELSLDETRRFFLSRGAYFAHVGGCDLRVKYGGIKGALAQKGLFFLHASGQGTVFCQSFGAIISRELAEGEIFVVDNRFVIAFSDTITYQFVKATSNIKDALMSGEGFVNRYTGPGTIYYQSRTRPTQGLVSRIIDTAF